MDLPHPPEPAALFAPKLLTGVEPVDRAWGGFYRGGSYLVYGRVASGRDLLTLRFVQAGAFAGESCLFISPARPKDLMIQAASIGFNLRAAYEAGHVKLLRIPPSLSNPDGDDEGILRALRDLVAIVRQHRPQRLVVNDFMPFVLFRSFERLRAAVVEMLEHTDVLDMTMLIVMSEPGNDQSRRIVEFVGGQMTGVVHIEAVGDAAESTERRLTLLPNIGHLRRRAVELWDLEELTEALPPPLPPEKRRLAHVAPAFPVPPAYTPAGRAPSDSPPAAGEYRPIRLSAPIPPPTPAPEAPPPRAAEPPAWSDTPEPFPYERPVPPSFGTPPYAAPAPPAVAPKQADLLPDVELLSSSAREADAYGIGRGFEEPVVSVRQPPPGFDAAGRRAYDAPPPARAGAGDHAGADGEAGFVPTFAPTRSVAPASLPASHRTSDRDTFASLLQQRFLERSLHGRSFLLVAMRLDRTGEALHPYGFSFVSDLVQHALGANDALFVEPDGERLIALLADAEPDASKAFFGRLKARLRADAPAHADILLHAVSAILVPNGEPFHTAEDVLAYVLDNA